MVDVAGMAEQAPRAPGMIVQLFNCEDKMPADPRDDFGAFAGTEHMMFGLSDPFGLIREETEKGLRRQVPDTILERIATQGEPKFLTLGKKVGDGSQIVVSHFGFCVRARLSVSYEGGTRHEEIESLLTFLFGEVDQPGAERCRTHFDLHGDAERNFTGDAFRARFIAFRNEAHR